MMLGTNWVAPNAGDAPSTILYHTKQAEPIPDHVTAKLQILVARGDKPTNLQLTGKPLQAYDYDRLKVMQGL